MSGYYGDYPTSAVVYMVFDSFAASTGAPSATSNFAAGDIQIYKDGSDTQRSSSNGITVTTSFDSQTGLQMVAIDTSDNTDAGFYAAGHEYQVAVADITVDSQTVRFWLGAFSIERAGGVLAKVKDGSAKVDVTKWLTGTPNALQSGRVDSYLGAAASGVIAAATFAANALDAVWSTTTRTLSSGGVQAIWDALTSALTTSGSIGKLLVDNVNATISSRLASASYTAPLDAAGTRTAVGLASANLDTQLGAIDDYIDTEVAAIKAKTDQLTFTVSGQVDANIESVNTVEVIGDGDTTKWGPAP